MTDSVYQQLQSAREQLVQRLRDGNIGVCEAVLRDHPKLADDHERVLELILTEYLMRVELGQDPQPSEYYDRFPNWRVQIERLLKIDEAISSGQPTLLPESALLRSLSGYRIIRRIGDGGMSTVYLAEQLSIQRQVALKILHPVIGKDRDVVERFHREAVVLGMLSHPNIAKVHASGVENGIHYLAMEHCQGESLRTLLDRREDPTVTIAEGSDSNDWYRLVLESAIRVAGAIEYAHAHGVLHRDIKPSNVIVNTDTDDVWVVDFGLAKVLGLNHRTLTQGMLGTPHFSSPEQLTGGPIDARSDIYSLGATTKRLLSRRRAPDGTLQWLHGVTDDLKRVIGRATEKEPELRHRSMESLRKDLEAIARGQKPKIPRSRLGRMALLYARQHRIQVIVSSIFLCVFTLLSALYFIERCRMKDVTYRRHVESAVLKLEFAQLLTNSDPDYRRLVDYFKVNESGAVRKDLDPLHEALADLEVAMSILPRRPEAHYYRAKTLFALGRANSGNVELSRTLREHPGFAPARALQLLRDHQSGTVHDELNAPRSMSSSFQSGWPRAWFQAHYAMAQRRWSDAAQAYGEILEMADEPFIGCFLGSYLGRGSANLESGRLGPAIEDLAAVKARQSRAAEPALLIGKAYLLNGEESLADEVFQRAHSASSSKDSVALWVALLYQRQKRPRRSHGWVERIENDYVRGLARILILQRLKQWQAAELASVELLQSYPDSARLFDQLADSLVNQARFAEATSAAQRAIQLDGKLAHPYVVIGVANLRSGKLEEAMHAFRQAIQRRPNKAYLYRDIAFQLHEDFRCEEAAEMYREAIRLEPNNAANYGGLGATYERLRRFGDALEQYREAVRLAPRVSNHYTCLARQYHWKGDWCAWINACLTAIELDPHDWAPAEMLFNAVSANERYFACPDGSLHETCGGGARLVDVLRRITASTEDGRLLSILALAYCHVPEHRDYIRALETARRAVETPTAHLPDVLDAFVQVSKYAMGGLSASQPDRLHVLEFLPALPPYFAVDALLQEHGFPADEECDRLLDRFSAVSASGADDRRRMYLQGRFDQHANRWREAAECYRAVIENDESPEPILRLVECLRATGDANGEQELRRGIMKSRGNVSYRASLAQWDFDGALASSVGGASLTAHAAAPAEHPSVSFQRETIAGGSAKVATFSRGTFFRIPHGLSPTGLTPLDQYTLILDVRLSLDASLTAIFQTDPGNADNAEWLAHRKRGLGYQDFGGTIRKGHWHRLALVVDTTEGHLASFIDGEQVQSISIRWYNAHGRFALQSTALLFADESQENSRGSINSLQIRPYAMNPAEIASFGGATADGVPLP